MMTMIKARKILIAKADGCLAKAQKAGDPFDRGMYCEEASVLYRAASELTLEDLWGRVSRLETALRDLIPAAVYEAARHAGEN